FRQADFAFFQQTLKGQQQLETRAELCIGETDDRLGDVLGKAFVEDSFGPVSKTNMQTMVRTIKAAMTEEIRGASWMSDDTKKAAQAKLNSIVARIGYPDLWREYLTHRMTKHHALRHLDRLHAVVNAIDLTLIGLN